MELRKMNKEVKECDVAKCGLCKKEPERLKKCRYCKQHQNSNYTELFVLEVPISEKLAIYFKENPREDCIMKQELLGEFNYLLDGKLKEYEWGLAYSED